MNKVFVDTSVWIEYFKNGHDLLVLDELINDDRICINKIVLAELIPFLEDRNEKELIDILQNIDEIPLEIDWDDIIGYQVLNLQNKIRRVGIPDLIIMQSVLENNIELMTLDRHFILMKSIHKLKLFSF